MNTDKDDATAIVAHLLRIVMRSNGDGERVQLAAEISDVLCGELGLDPFGIGLEARKFAQSMASSQ